MTELKNAIEFFNSRLNQEEEKISKIRQSFEIIRGEKRKVIKK